MKRLLLLFALLAAIFTATAQSEHSIIIDQSSFREIHYDALTGVNIDPIGVDSSRRPCARIKVKINRMSREDIDKLEVKIHSNNQLTKSKTAEYDNGLIVEMTAKNETCFYFHHPEFGYSNEVNINLEPNKEYYLEASLNQTFSIIIDSNTAGADVYLDNIFKGTTDSNFRCTIKSVLIGPHSLKLSYGNLSHKQQIAVNSDNISFRQNINIAASEPQFVVFAIEPQNAIVTINNKHYTLNEGAMKLVLDSGTYDYTITAVGYHPHKGSFTVAGEKVIKQVSLKIDAVTITLTAPNNAEIWVNEEKKGKGSWTGSLASGTYIFEARKEGYKSSVTSKQISSTQQKRHYELPAPTPIYGSIMVDGTPILADVSLDDKHIGQTPLKFSNILVGDHSLTVSKNGYETKTQSITISEDKITTAYVTLKKKNILDIEGVEPIEIDISIPAQDLYKLGCTYYNRRDYNAAVQYYYAASIKGDANAQNNLGYCYKLGKGIAQNYIEAVKWFRKAAEQGNTNAQNSLGFCYEEGTGVPQDYVEAAKWIHKAAEQGDANAQNNLGYYYKEGKGVPQDYVEAVKWIRKAAEQGNANAQNNLGFFYQTGKGVPQDYNEAVTWFLKSAEQGYVNAQDKLGDCYFYSLGIEQDYQEAVKWYFKAANQGYARSQYNLGQCFFNGYGVEQDYNEALKWYKQSAEQNYVDAQYNLGYCYYNGEVIEQNYYEAFGWFKLAAEQNHIDAQYYLGCCCYSGNGTEQNFYEAVKWFTLAAELKNIDAQYNLGCCYFNGEGVEQNYTEAVRWFREAADKENADAQYNLGTCYEDGIGVDQDYTEAFKWYRKSAEQGHKNAQYSLGLCYRYGNGVPIDTTEAIKWFRKSAEQGNELAKKRLEILVLTT